jgi:hypothetical protein
MALQLALALLLSQHAWCDAAYVHSADKSAHVTACKQAGLQPLPFGVADHTLH